MAGKIYVNQPLALTLDCQMSLAGATALAVAARKPDGTEVTWAGATPSGATTMVYLVPQGALDQSGTWCIQALPTIGGDTIPGETAELQVYARFG